MKPSVKLVLGAVCVLLGAISQSPAQACDDPVWQVARTQWYPEMYYFYHLYQEGVPDSEAATKRLTDFESKELAEVNVAIIPLNLSKRIIDSVDRITLTLTEGRTLVWGSAEESELKSQVAAALFASTEAEVYDVSAPRHPTTK